MNTIDQTLPGGDARPASKESKDVHSRDLDAVPGLHGHEENWDACFPGEGLGDGSSLGGASNTPKRASEPSGLPEQ